jgi:hypothetical protein
VATTSAGTEWRCGCDCADDDEQAVSSMMAEAKNPQYFMMIQYTVCSPRRWGKSATT